MDMLADFTAASRELMTVLGDSQPGTVARAGIVSEPLTLFVDDALQEVGQHGRVSGPKRAVSAMNTDWLFERGDIVTVRGRTAKVADIVSNDGIMNTVMLHG